MEMETESFEGQRRVRLAALRVHATARAAKAAAMTQGSLKVDAHAANAREMTAKLVAEGERLVDETRKIEEGGVGNEEAEDSRESSGDRAKGRGKDAFWSERGRAPRGHMRAPGGIRAVEGPDQAREVAAQRDARKVDQPPAAPGRSGACAGCAETPRSFW